MERGKLKRNVKGFRKLRSDRDRILFAKKLLPKGQVQLKVKSIDKSLEFKNLADVSYQQENYIEALELYYAALANAPPACFIVPLIYNDLSILYMVGQLYNVAIACIDAAIAKGYPKERKGKLEQRRIMCLYRQQLKDAKEPPEPFVFSEAPKLFNEPMTHYPGIADCLLFNRTSDRWTLLATKDIQPGDNLVVETVFYKCIGKHQRFLHCSNCLGTLKCFFPCSNCCDTLFCSKECQAEANASFHQYDCGLSWPFGDETFSNFLKLSLRLFLSTFKHFTTAEAFQNLLNEMRDNPMSAMSPFHSQEAQKIRLLFSSKRPVTDFKNMEKKLNYAYSVAHMFKELLAKKSFVSRFPNPEDQDVLLLALYTLSHAGATDMQTRVDFASTYAITKYAAIFPVCNMADETPTDIKWLTSNCYMMFNGKASFDRFSLKIFALRPIRMGERIVIKEKMLDLVNTYFRAAMEGPMAFQEYNTSMRLPHFRSQPPRWISLEGLKTDPPEEELRSYIEFLVENDKYHPCRELLEVELRLALFKCSTKRLD